ncbi:AAA family ATPase [Synechocystis sp. PCC 7338]|uniref:AAA family ATPase n=2 Tax=unclassified Synechocystis TaxID=2640012 RepID=UPI001BAF7997|nr:AAA family ATPase [Synechocystis sp. PCC 7338]QUS61430.1 AAA family ATPase [Synechocystis sp. PCC 7338]
MANPAPFQFDPRICRNEKEVETKLIVQHLLPFLGYTPESWHQEVTFGNIRLDFLAFATQILPFTVTETSPLSLIIEAKSPNQNLDKHAFKLANYMRSLRVPYGVLTNGLMLRIYERQHDQVNLIFSCPGSEISANLDSIKQIIGKKELSSSLKTIPVPVQPSNPLPQQPMKVIAVYHNKGGVGKTTTVVNLAAALAKQRKRVLIVDLDSQANTTYATGLVKFVDEANDDIKGNNIMQVIQSRDEYQIAEVARKASFSQYNIDVIPSHIELMEEEKNLNEREPAKIRLLNKLKKTYNHYDIVIIDTPPSLNLYAKIALITADFLLIPSDLKPFSHEGLNNVKRFIAQINETKEMYGMEDLKILGVLPSKISTNAKFLSSNYPKRRKLVQTKYDLPIMDSMICEREDLAKCLENSIAFGDDLIPDPRSVLDFKPDSPSSHEFEVLAMEILEKINS